MLSVKEVPFHRTHITEEEIGEVVDSLRSGWLTMGPKTLRFEEDFKGYLGVGHAVSMNSCTSSLHLALRALGIGPGDEVIVPDITFSATAEAVCYTGATPVIVDVEEYTGNIDIGAVERAITPKTRSIIPVHYTGQPCDMDELRLLAEPDGIYLVEDAAHSLPAWYKGAPVGSTGDITCFSFYATKTLSTGEGGMAVTACDEWASSMKRGRLHGISRDAWDRYSKEGAWFYEVVELGYKYNMTDIQAALGLIQLKKLERMWKCRVDIARRYTEAFENISDIIYTPVVKSDRISSWHLYVVQLNIGALCVDRASIIEQLKLAGVSTSVHFIPLHIHPFYRDTFGISGKDFPVAEERFKRMISLPIYPGMTDTEVDFVIDTVISTLKRYRR